MSVEFYCVRINSDNPNISRIFAAAGFIFKKNRLEGPA